MASTPVNDAPDEQGRQGAGVKSRTVVDDCPSSAPAHHAVALGLCGEGLYDRACAHLEQALALAPTDVGVARDLGAVYATLTRWTDAACVLMPFLNQLDSAGIALYLVAAVEAGLASDAVRATSHLPLLTSPHAQLLCEYGRACYAAGDVERAELFLTRALKTDPVLARAHHTLASVLHDNGRGDLALEHAQADARLRPFSAPAQLRLAVAYASRGRSVESRAARALAIRLGLSGSDLSAAIKLMLLDEDEAPSTILAMSRSCFPGSAARFMHPRARRSGRRRIGYLSGEFRATPNFHFFRSFLERHDRACVELFLYSNDIRPDAYTTAYHGMSEHWRDVGQLADDELLKLLDADALDVLVDLSGHFPANRLSVFARRAVAVQATFPGCPSTTGCAEIDYFFTDAWTSPDGSAQEYSEHLHHLPSGYLVYTSPYPAPTTPLPALRRRAITFGMLQQNSKLSPAMWDAFAEVLRRTPHSELLLHTADAELDRPASDTSRSMHMQLATRGVDPARLRLTGPRPLHGHFQILGEIDLALDTWPYNGQTTTCECLWMGVPVITRKGRTHVGRVAAGLLERAGLSELVATSADSYVETAIRLAADTDALVRYRATLRDRIVSSGLTNGSRLARELEQAYHAWTD